MGDSPKDANKVEILLSSVTNEFIEKRLDMLEAIGLNVIAFEPDALAAARAIIPCGRNYYPNGNRHGCSINRS